MFEDIVYATLHILPIQNHLVCHSCKFFYLYYTQLVDNLTLAIVYRNKTTITFSPYNSNYSSLDFLRHKERASLHALFHRIKLVNNNIPIKVFIDKNRIQKTKIICNFNLNYS